MSKASAKFDVRKKCCSGEKIANDAAGGVLEHEKERKKCSTDLSKHLH